MSEVNVSIDDVLVIKKREFCTCKGYGLDIHTEAKSKSCTVYLQIVLYDDRAKKAYNKFLEGDYLAVKGTLKVKNYTKKDGTVGISLVIENPDYLCQVSSYEIEKRRLSQERTIQAGTIQPETKNQTDNEVKPQECDSQAEIPRQLDNTASNPFGSPEDEEEPPW